MATFGKMATLEEALKTLRDAEHDVAMEYGEEGLEAGYSDLIESIAFDCTPEVGAELRRMKSGYLE